MVETREPSGSKFNMFDEVRQREVGVEEEEKMFGRSYSPLPRPRKLCVTNKWLVVSKMKLSSLFRLLICLLTTTILIFSIMKTTTANEEAQINQHQQDYMASGAAMKNQDFIKELRGTMGSPPIARRTLGSKVRSTQKTDIIMINGGQQDAATPALDSVDLIDTTDINHHKIEQANSKRQDNWLVGGANTPIETSTFTTSLHQLSRGTKASNIAQSNNKRSLPNFSEEEIRDSDRSQINDNNNKNSETMTSSAQTETTTSNNDSSLKCRIEKNLYLDFEEYAHYTCANCYKPISFSHMPKILFTRKFQYKKESRIWLYDELARRPLLPNETETIKTTFKAEYSYHKWQECCRQAVFCCRQNSKYLPKTTNAEGDLIDEEPREKCHATWDGLGCWPDSPAGLIAQHDCPDHVYFLEFVPVCTGQVTKQCFSNGSWFIRNDHEWSDYNSCAVLPLYATRLLIGSVWHLVSAIVIGPALIVLDKLPNRGGSKRVKILSNLLFWLLVNGLLAATQKVGIIGGIFQAPANPDDPPPPPSSILHSANLNQSRLSYGAANQPPMVADTVASHVKRRQTRETATLDKQQQQRRRRPWPTHNQSPTWSRADSWNQKLEKAKVYYEQLAQTTTSSSYDGADCDGYNITQQDNDDNNNNINDYGQRRTSRMSVKDKTRSWRGNNDEVSENSFEESLLLTGSGYNTKLADNAANSGDRVTIQHIDNYSSPLDNNNNISYDDHKTSSALVKGSQRQTNIKGDEGFLSTTSSPPSTGRFSRCKRSTTNQAGRAPRKQQSVAVVFVCWIFSVGIRITRLLGYAWMFTGAVYLCSVLHFAPAEPPASFIKWLMILTNGFPVVIGLVYIIARTIYEPSPLTLLVESPYYYLTGDIAYVEYLWATQLDCWLLQSKNDSIEEIADFPNLVLIILNGGLFVVTLIIMCRINRPGSTRPEMSLGDYFKAAGTLVLLYGAHYALFVYRPQVEGCIKGQVTYYSFLFVDGIQGIAVSYVFCYRTPEGRDIISKWWRENMPNWCLCSRQKRTTREHPLLNANSRSNQSTRSNNSACNGKDTATELININDTPVASQF